MKSFVIVFVVLVSLPLISYGKDISPEEGQCFSNTSCGEMVVQLENYDKQVEIISLLKEENSELEIKIKNLNEIIRLQELRITNAESSIDSLNKIIKDQKVLYEKQIEEERPSFFDKLGWGASGSVVGFLVCAILLL